MFELILAVAAQLGSPGAVQASSPPPANIPSQLSDDIVVTGLRDLDDPRSAVTRSTLNGMRTGAGTTKSKEVFERSRQFAKCVLKRGSLASLTLVRGSIDGRIDSSRQRFSQERLAQTNSACAEDPTEAQRSGRPTLTGLYDASYYDRGAMIIEVIDRYAPDLALTRRDTANLQVQARFNAREVSKAKFRLPVDRRYFEVAICLVRTQPEYAVRLIAPNRSMDQIQRLEAAMVNASPECTGRARRVYFDPIQFRFYIADAVYRWALAVRGIDSLIGVR